MTPRAWLAAVALVALGAVGGITVDRLHIRGRHGEMARLHERLRDDPMAVIDRVKARLREVQAAMPAGMTAILLARMYGGRPAVAVQVVIATTVLSLLTLPWIITWGSRWIGL